MQPTATVSAAPSAPVPAGHLTPVAGVLIAVASLALLGACAGLLVRRRRSRTKEASATAWGLEFANIHHIGAREDQQDTFGISDILSGQREKGVLAVVADGMGGLQNGGAVSRLVTGDMLAYFPKLAADIPPKDQLLYMIAHANGELMQQMPSNPGEQGGTTLVAALIKDGFLSFASVGDSRIALKRGGALVQLNREHTYGHELDLKAVNGQISFEKSQSDPQRRSLASYLGMDTIAAIDVSPQPIPLVQGDVLLMMTDGVFNTLGEEKINELITSKLQDSAQNLSQAVLTAGKPKQDNFTAVLIRVSSGGRV